MKGLFFVNDFKVDSANKEIKEPSKSVNKEELVNTFMNGNDNAFEKDDIDEYSR